MGVGQRARGDIAGARIGGAPPISQTSLPFVSANDAARDSGYGLPHHPTTTGTGLHCRTRIERKTVFEPRTVKPDPARDVLASIFETGFEHAEEGRHYDYADEVIRRMELAGWAFAPADEWGSNRPWNRVILGDYTEAWLRPIGAWERIRNPDGSLHCWHSDAECCTRPGHETIATYYVEPVDGATAPSSNEPSDA